MRKEVNLGRERLKQRERAASRWGVLWANKVTGRTIEADGSEWKE